MPKYRKILSKWCEYSRARRIRHRHAAGMIPPRILKAACRTLDRHLKAPWRSAGAETVLRCPCEIRRQTEGSAQRCPAVAFDIPGQSDSRVEDQKLRLHGRAV